MVKKIVYMAIKLCDSDFGVNQLFLITTFLVMCILLAVTWMS